MLCGSSDGENCKHRKYKCLIPFMRCSSGKASNGVADFFHTMEQFVPLQHSLCSGKCAWCAFLPFFSCCCFLGLSTSATQVSESQPSWWRTITKNWTQVVWGCSRHHVQTFVLWYCATRSVAFFWIFFSIFFQRKGSIAISSCSCMKTACGSLNSFGAMTFLLNNRNKNGRKTENTLQVWIQTRHLLHVELHTVCHCHTADRDS